MKDAFFRPRIPLAQHKNHTIQYKWQKASETLINCHFPSLLVLFISLPFPKAHWSHINTSVRVHCPVGRGMSGFNCLWGVKFLPFMVLEPPDSWGWQGPWEVSSPSSCPEQVLPWGQTRLLRALPGQRSKPSKGGDDPSTCSCCFLPVPETLNSEFNSVVTNTRHVFSWLLGGFVQG